MLFQAGERSTFPFDLICPFPCLPSSVPAAVRLSVPRVLPSRSPAPSEGRYGRSIANDVPSRAAVLHLLHLRCVTWPMLPLPLLTFGHQLLTAAANIPGGPSRCQPRCRHRVRPPPPPKVTQDTACFYATLRGGFITWVGTKRVQRNVLIVHTTLHCVHRMKLASTRFYSSRPKVRLYVQRQDRDRGSQPARR